mmetsp:Transcript_5742/g.10487  ORF Transcript_5742/g.10487 Transcript_5742/m.10487 type:complete len:223 (+) Transcript_5742:134-802(+)
MLRDQPVIVDTPSNRSKCKACVYGGGGDPTIRMGSKRVGIPGRAAGVTVQHWCHPACFAQHCLRVEFAKTGRSKCKADGGEIAKGALRLLIGYQKDSTVYKVENVHRTIVPELVALVGRTNVIIHGLSELSLTERLRVESLLFDSSGGGASSEGSSKEQEAASKAEVASRAEAKRKHSDLCVADEMTTAMTPASPTKKARGEGHSAKWTLKAVAVDFTIELD